MLSIIRRFWYGPARAFVPPVPMMAECKRCETIVRTMAANRLTVHLIHDHKMDDAEAYDTVNWVFQRLLDHLRRDR